MNKKFTLSQGVIFIIIFIIIVPFITKLIARPEEKEIESFNNTNIEIPKIVEKEESKNTKKVSNLKIKEFFKKENNKEIDDINNFDIKLTIIKSLEGENLDNNYKIPSFSSIEADPSFLLRHFNPGDNIELVDYKYEEPWDTETMSRCKVKKVGELDNQAGWLNCGWINTEIKEKESISNNEFEKNKIGEFIDLGDMDFKVVSIKETSKMEDNHFKTIELLNPKATEGAKFVVLEVEIKNKLKEKANFSEYERFILIDGQERRYEPYDSSGSEYSVPESIMYQDLSPSIMKKGVLVYEVPKDESKYAFMFKTISDDIEFLVK